MGFMELQTEYGDWYEVDGNDGGAIIPADLIMLGGIARGPLEGYQFRRLVSALADYYSGSTIYSVELVCGWCARYSAPGYMDCTDWCGPYPTEREAVDECKRLFGDDQDDQDDETEVGETEVAP